MMPGSRATKLLDNERGIRGDATSKEDPLKGEKEQTCGRGWRTKTVKSYFMARDHPINHKEGKSPLDQGPGVRGSQKTDKIS